MGEREPERSRQLEAGVKTQWLGGRAFATVAAYHLERNDIAIPDATGVTRQNGDQRSRGIEVELSGEPAATWFTSASYAFTDAELTRFAEIVAEPGRPAAVRRRRLVRQHARLRAPPHLQLVDGEAGGRAEPSGAGARYVGRAVHRRGQRVRHRLPLRRRRDGLVQGEADDAERELQEPDRRAST